MKRDIEFFTIMTSFMQSVRYSIHNPYGQVRNTYEENLYAHSRKHAVLRRKCPRSRPVADGWVH